MSDDEDFSDGIGASDEDHDVSDSDGEGAEAPQAAHKRTDKRDAATRRTATPFGAGGAKFAEAVAKLLAPGGDAPGPTKLAAAATQGAARAGQVPILSRSRTVTKRVEDEHAERLRLRAVRRHKRELKSAGHVKPTQRGVDPGADARERALRVTATKGVVTLFNAVAKAQKTRREAEQVGNTKAVAELVPRTFFNELRRAAGVSEQGPAGGGGDKRPGWAVLRDDFARGGPGASLKAWERAGARDEVVIKDTGDAEMDDDGEDDV